MEKIVAPTLIVDEDKCRRNIRHMAAKARKSSVAFRPHFKTHQSLAIGNWFRSAGIDRIAVSSVSMAKFFADDDWKDIMVAFPVNILEMDQINELASRIDLSILIADGFVLQELKSRLKYKAGFYIKIDIGNNRSGYLPENMEEIERVLNEAAEIPNLIFKGFVAHAGQTYITGSLNDVHRIYNTESKRLCALTRHFRQFYPEIITSWGDTPTCSLVDDFNDIDEIRPGNFVFYDLMQFHLASCDFDHIAVAVAAPVVSRQDARGEVVVYAGAVHLSKDYLELSDEGKVFGEVVLLNERGWERFTQPVYLNRISQEHGIFSCPPEYRDQFTPGTLVGIIPVHSCLTANLLKGNFYNFKTDEWIKD
jgi:D-serine deaminase-like pyridoxal phosphate-dependent protein